MRVLHLAEEARRFARSARSRGELVGLVPTMGALHEGHLSLLRLARQKADRVMVTLFVNPLQFGPKEDLERYPRDFERDRGLCEREGADVLFAPDAAEMYPPEFCTRVEVPGPLTAGLCGARRPGHFTGVATVVTKLLAICEPDLAVFGQKDAQQAAVIRQMTRDLSYPTEIVVCPIVREPDGLAMSSRNVYLDPEQRKAATVLYRALSAAQKDYEKGEHNAEKLRQVMRNALASEPLAQMQYVSCANYDTLEELDEVKGKTLLSMAVFVGKTRLIDNFVLG
jgi:pantoate--beta-alanine ligase